MIGGLRTGLAIAAFGLLTPPLALVQWIALRTGLCSADIVPRLWHQLILKCLGMRVRVVGGLSAKRPLLVAANHVSWSDVMVLGAREDVRFIAKAEVAGWPGIGTIARLNRTVFVERERKARTGETAGEIASRLAGGEALVLFAEGTTSDGNVLLPFKSSLFGAARLAIDEAGAETVYIQPVALAYTRLHGMPLGRRGNVWASWVGDRSLAPHLTALLRERALDVELRFGEPIAFTASSSRKETARQVEEAVRAMLRAIRANPEA